MSIGIRLGALVLACSSVGCVAASDVREEGEDPTEALPTPEPASGRATHVDRPQEGGALGSGKLVEAFGRSARASLCVSLDAAGDINALDEVSCETAWLVHECTSDECPWVSCGDCLFRIERPNDGPWVMTPRPGNDSCAPFNGRYEIQVDSACQTALPPSNLQPDEPSSR